MAGDNIIDNGRGDHIDILWNNIMYKVAKKGKCYIINKYSLKYMLPIAEMVQSKHRREIGYIDQETFGKVSEMIKKDGFIMGSNICYGNINKARLVAKYLNELSNKSTYSWAIWTFYVSIAIKFSDFFGINRNEL